MYLKSAAPQFEENKLCSFLLWTNYGTKCQGNLDQCQTDLLYRIIRNNVVFLMPIKSRKKYM